MLRHDGKGPYPRRTSVRRSIPMRVGTWTIAASLSACVNSWVPPVDAGRDVARTDTFRSDATDTRDVGVDVSATLDDAQIVSATYPDHLSCGQTSMATVVVRNTGTATWTRAGGYKLGAIGDSDPLHPGDARIWLGDTESVPPGSTHSFDIPLVAPSAGATVTTDWQMVHETVQWFGGTTSHDVIVDCAADAGTDVSDAGASITDTGPVTPFDFATAHVLNSPSDIATWAQTATITGINFQSTGVHIDFTKRDGTDSWPDVPFGAPGDSLEYTLWIVLNIGGEWYTSGCLQYWRGLDQMGGPPSQYAMNWYYDPIRWAPMTGHQPAVGEMVGFFVSAGNARNVTDHSGSIVFERSNVVMVPFPDDTGANLTF